MNIKLNENFLAELFKQLFIERPIIEICNQYLKYQLIPKEFSSYKVILKEALTTYNRTQKLPSLGVISQKYTDNEDVQQTIDDIKEAVSVDTELLIDQLESFIKDNEFQILSKKVADLYNSGKKEESMRLNLSESQRILTISLRDCGGKFLKLYKDFPSIYKQNKETTESDDKIARIPFGIDCIDDVTYGGADPIVGDLVLWIMRSGVGKSTVLRWAGFTACNAGVPVLHIQLEGGAISAFNKYSQIWTHQTYRTITRGAISDSDWKKIQKTLKDAENWEKEIEIYSFEKFGEATVTDVRNLILEYQKLHGEFPKLVVIDSLDLLATGENKKVDTDPSFLKYKLQKSAQLLKNIATEFKLVITTAAQTSDVPMEIWNDEDKVIDRSYTEGDKTLVKPFSFVFTGNVTIDEQKNNLLRIYLDKLRDYSSRGAIYRIATDYNYGRFYDRKTTLSMGETFVGERKKQQSKTKTIAVKAEKVE